MGSPSTKVLPSSAPLAVHLARAAPGVAIEVVVPWSPDTLAGLEQGRFSFALYADSDLPNDFHTRGLNNEGYPCLLRSGTRLCLGSRKAGAPQRRSSAATPGP